MELKTRDKIIVVVLVIVALAVFFGGRYRDNHTHFTTEKWVSAVGNDRQKIVQNLLDRTVFPGMTKAEVKELLGEPEEETDTFLTYYLGIPQGIFGTSVDGEKEYLLISLDADGKATAAEVMTGKVLPKEPMSNELADIGNHNLQGFSATIFVDLWIICDGNASFLLLNFF